MANLLEHVQFVLDTAVVFLDAIMKSFLATAGATYVALFGLSNAGSLEDIDHVVLFMQENRAFDHYFGTMAGVRGFSDPNVQVNPGNRPVWYQDVNSTLSNATDSLLPWYLNYLGGDWLEATQCMAAGDNGWNDNQAALNGDLNNKWALNNTPWSWGYFKRNDLPVHFGIAEGWTVGDMYQESVIASTNPNRVSWISGSINVPGSPQSPDEGGVTIDNNEIPGCEGPHLNCYPTTWKTCPEYYEDAGVTWQLYQDTNNFDDNPLAWFKQFQTASNSSSLGQRGMSFIGLDKFYADAAAGTLPQISYVVGPAELSEHPPYQPKDGAWLQQQVVNAVVRGKAYRNTVLIISFDETGGFGDHVTPYHSPPDTPGEWMQDPYGNAGNVYTGPGFRLPFYIVSPWTRGGHVFVERADHISQIKFVERWLAAKGYNVTSEQIPSWRREHMSDLIKAFDFSNPDYSIPSIPLAETPSTTDNGTYNGYALCEATYPTLRPPVPYGSQSQTSSLVSEQGFKPVRGELTEGRFLVFEMNGFALANPGDESNRVRGNGVLLSTTAATAGHEGKEQRWIVHHQPVDGNGVGSRSLFRFESPLDGRVLAVGADGQLVLIDGTEEGGKEKGEGVEIAVEDLGNGKGYSVMVNGAYLGIGEDGNVRTRLENEDENENLEGFKVFSVTYDN